MPKNPANRIDALIVSSIAILPPKTKTKGIPKKYAKNKLIKATIVDAIHVARFGKSEKNLYLNTRITTPHTMAIFKILIKISSGIFIFILF